MNLFSYPGTLTAAPPPRSSPVAAGGSTRFGFPFVCMRNPFLNSLNSYLRNNSSYRYRTVPYTMMSYFGAGTEKAGPGGSVVLSS